MVIVHMRINVTKQALGWILCDANCGVFVGRIWIRYTPKYIRDLMVITRDVRHKLSHDMNVLKLLQVIKEAVLKDAGL